MNIYALGFRCSLRWPLPLSNAVLRLSFTAVSSLLSLRLICLLSNQCVHVCVHVRVYVGRPVTEGPTEIESSLHLSRSVFLCLSLHYVVLAVEAFSR